MRPSIMKGAFCFGQRAGGSVIIAGRFPDGKQTSESRAIYEVMRSISKINLRGGSRPFPAWALLAGLALALALRLVSLPALNNDLLNGVLPWHTYITEHGHAAAWKDDFYVYTPSYIYLLTASSFVPIYRVVVIKCISIAFDFLGAFFVYKIVQLRHKQSPMPAIAALLVLLAPTVFINSSYWGQIDMMYTSMLLGTVYFALARRPLPAMIAFGFAFAFKLQSMFLAPWLLFMLLRGRLPWKSIIVPPLIYVLTLLPAAAMGRPLGDMLLIYLRQTEIFFQLNMNIANLYVFIPNTYYSIVTPIGLALAALIALGIAFLAFRSRADLSDELLLLTALVSVAVMPFVLPKMHDRYFFPADVFSILVIFFLPRLRIAPLAFQATSLSAYLYFLAGRFVFPLEIMAFVNLFVIGWLVIVWFGSLYPHSRLAPLANRFTQPAANGESMPIEA